MITSHEIAQTLLAKANSSHRADAESYVAHSLRAAGLDASEDGTGRGTPLVAHALDSFSAGRMTEDGTGRGCPIVPVAFDCKAGGNTGFNIGAVPGALRDEGFGGGHAAIAFGIGSDAVDRSGEGAAGNAAQRSGLNIVEGCQPSLRARPNNSVATASAVRRLTPRECERLQGFPDDYTAITYRKKSAADGPRYKALGNSMAVPVMRWILSRIEVVNALGVPT